jgi:hypothetical protein
MIEFIDHSFTISLNHNKLQHLTIIYSILPGLWLSSRLARLLMCLAWFRFANALVLGSPLYCDCLRLRLTIESLLSWTAAYHRRSLLLGRIHGHAWWSRSNDLVSNRLQLPFSYPWTRFFNTQRWFVFKNRISAETCLPIRFLETAYMSLYRVFHDFRA